MRWNPPLWCPKCQIEVLQSPKPVCPECEGPLEKMPTLNDPMIVPMPPAPEPPPAPKALEVTAKPIHMAFEAPRSIQAMLDEGGPSLAGYSAVSSFLSCPERARLKSLGIRPKRAPLLVNGQAVIAPLDALGYGSLWHVLMALRAYNYAYGFDGQQCAVDQLEWYGQHDLHPDSKMKALSALKIYDQAFPFQADPLQYIGVECDVVSDIGVRDPFTHQWRPLLRTVRYDAVVRVMQADGTWSRGVFSLERKTSASGSRSSLDSYMPQFWVQTALWNANPYLVATYGPMEGVINDVVTKTIVPQAFRIGPHYVTSLQQKRALAYLRYTDTVRFPVEEDGSFPMFLHTCWGRFGACSYIGLCHEEEFASYEQVTPGLVAPELEENAA